MKSIVLVLVCLWLALDNVATARRRYHDQIVGGEEAKPGEFPFLARLLVEQKGEVKTCAGSIIDQRHILTATHCLIDGDPEQTHMLVTPDKVKIKIGCHKPDDCASDSKPIKVKRIMAYYYFGPKLNNDIALIKVTSDIKYKKNAGAKTILPINLAQSDPVCAPTHYRSGGRNSSCEMLTFAGWGDVSGKRSPQKATELRKAQIPSVPFEKCKQSYPFIKKTVMCAGDTTRGACFGDSGGPLLRPDGGKYLQVGISSFVGPDECVSPSGGGFTLVGPYYKWIQSCIKGQGCKALLSDMGSELGTGGELSAPYPRHKS